MITERPIDFIVRHAEGYWLHHCGFAHKVVFASPIEVITVAAEESWLGTADEFVLEFEPILS